MRIGKSKNKKALERIQRRDIVSKMYIEGKAVAVIAHSLGVSVNTVGKDLEIIREEWLKRSVERMEQRKADELARLDRLEAVAWEAWERSKEPIEVKTIKNEDMRSIYSKGEKGSTSKFVPFKRINETKVTTGKGDPRYLEQIERCIQLRLKICGLLKTEMNHNHVTTINWNEMYNPSVVVMDKEPDLLEQQIASVGKIEYKEEHITSEQKNINSEIQMIVDDNIEVEGIDEYSKPKPDDTIPQRKVKKVECEVLE